VYKSRSGEPVPRPLSTPVVALLFSAWATSAGDAAGCASRYTAAAPATWGEAIEVPLNVVVATSLVKNAEVMFVQGANRSRQLPKLEYEALASDRFEAPAVRAWGALAGEWLHASSPSLPAATAYVTPALMEVWIASFRAV